MWASAGTEASPGRARDAKALALVAERDLHQRVCLVLLARFRGSRTQNSSPPSRAAIPPPSHAAASLRPSRLSSASPAGWPKVSL